jgi:uncharacterized membrane protein
MTKTRIVKWIVKAYFFAAIAASFHHLITAAGKAGLTGWEMWSVPFLIDGIAIIGLIMRGPEFSAATRQIGFRVQIVAGVLSLIGNVFAANNIGQAVYGVAIVALFIFSEWLSDRIESVEVDHAAAAQTKRQEAAAKAAATRKRNATKAKAVVKAAERITRQS